MMPQCFQFKQESQLNNLERQMEHFLNPLDLSSVSIKSLLKQKKKKGLTAVVKCGRDCADCLSFRFKRTDQMCDISLPIASHYKYLTELLPKPVQSEAKQCRPARKAFIVGFMFFYVLLST